MATATACAAARATPPPDPASLLAALALVLSGCEGIVDYDERDVIPPDQLQGAAGAAAIYAGAIRDFGAAFAGDGGLTEGQVMTSGMMADARIGVNEPGREEDNAAAARRLTPRDASGRLHERRRRTRR